MKRRNLLLVLACAMVLALGMVGCGSSEAPENNNNGGSGSNNNQVQNVEKGFYFEANGVKIYMDADMSTLVDKLGEPASYFEEPSCAVEGIAKIYTFSNYELETYPDGDRDLVAYVVIKDDTIATPEGIDLSMTKADVIATYGEDYEEAENSITYTKDGMFLRFILDGDYLASIEYSSAVFN